MRDHHLVDYELNVLLALAGRKPRMRWGAAYGQALEVLVGFGFAELDRDGQYKPTAAGVEVADSVCPPEPASH
ncbi:MAG: hypothetical protein EHM35_00995 [Planctomycetaceae bacterium]|nr:MAG: hypothetical protein EHM35_00995 [Planctomycetaceae bacterium]